MVDIFLLYTTIIDKIFYYVLTFGDCKVQGKASLVAFTTAISADLAEQMCIIKMLFWEKGATTLLL